MSELSKKARNRTRVQMVLTMLVIVSIIRQFFLGNYHNMFLGILTLILFMVPQFIDKKLGVTIPVGLETVILIFIFSAEILGEINAFYVKIPVWDTILHTTNGFLMAAIGFVPQVSVNGCKDFASERNESLLSNCRAPLNLLQR